MTNFYGITDAGFKAKRLIDVKNDLEKAFIGEFGEINLDPQSVTGQIIGVLSKVIADIWENLEDVYFSQYPNSASGISLDNVVQLNAIQRRPAEKTSVIGIASGKENTFIPRGSIAKIPANGESFISDEDAFITKSKLAEIEVSVATVLQPISYDILLDNVLYFYSLPTINFSKNFPTDSVIYIKINGINMPTVAFDTDQTTTMNKLATEMELFYSDIIGAVSTFPLGILIVPVLGKMVRVDSADVTGASPPITTRAFAIPSALNNVSQYLSAAINEVGKYNSTNLANNFTVTTKISEIPFTAVLGQNLSTVKISSPIPFHAQNYGPIPAPENSLTEIVTPIPGWQTITNFVAGITGRDTETDAELRLRRANSLKVTGAATVESIQSRISQEVPGVTSVSITENVTMTQADIITIFSKDLIAANTVTVNIDGTNRGSAVFSTTHLAQMLEIETILKAQPEIKNAVVGGTGNRQITISMKDTEIIEVLLSVTGGASQPTVLIMGGQPPKSFTAIVQGGSDLAIAQKIWETKPAGIATFGNVEVTIKDSKNNDQVIYFSRASQVYLWATVALVSNPAEVFPANGQTQVAETIVNYGNSLGLGEDVYLQRIQSQVFTVPGIASATVQLARTLLPTENPTYASADIIINPTEKSVWDVSRITVSI